MIAILKVLSLNYENHLNNFRHLQYRHVQIFDYLLNKIEIKIKMIIKILYPIFI
jgi:hypothetical protein